MRAMRATWGSELGRMRPWNILIFYTEQCEGGGCGHTWTSGDRLRVAHTEEGGGLQFPPPGARPSASFAQLWEIL